MKKLECGRTVEQMKKMIEELENELPTVKEAKKRTFMKAFISRYTKLINESKKA